MRLQNGNMIDMKACESDSETLSMDESVINFQNEHPGNKFIGLKKMKVSKFL